MSSALQPTSIGIDSAVVFEVVKMTGSVEGVPTTTLLDSMKSVGEAFTLTESNVITVITRILLVLSYHSESNAGSVLNQMKSRKRDIRS